MSITLRVFELGKDFVTLEYLSSAFVEFDVEIKGDSDDFHSIGRKSVSVAKLISQSLYNVFL